MATAEQAQLYREKNREQINQRARTRYLCDAEYRLKRLAQHKRWRSRNREMCREIMREWKRKNPRRCRDYQLKVHYGIAIGQYEAILAAQGGVCAICHLPCRKDLGVDHDHVTGRVRGLLCERCNTGIGRFFDDAMLVRAAATYLEHS